MSLPLITIAGLYTFAAALMAASRAPQYQSQSGFLVTISYLTATTGLLWHLMMLAGLVASTGIDALTIGNVASIIGNQLALIGLAAAIINPLRIISACLLLLGAALALLTNLSPEVSAIPREISWNIELHIYISVFAYGLLTVGAIIALFALLQEKRLRARQIGQTWLYAPLETTERLLFSVTTVGFLLLLIAVTSGFAFVDDLFAQHLSHKTILSLLALVVFGVLLAGRWKVGWRGLKAIYLYLGGYCLLALAYFGSRYVLEELLGLSWG